MRRTAPYKGFTLTELLIVITIIGMLAALVTVAAGAAMNAAKRSAIRMQMSQLEMAIENYRQKHGEYPPDGTDFDAVVRHLRKVFPKANINPTTLIADISVLLAGAGGASHGEHGGHVHLDPAQPLNPSTALYFWLGGVLAKNPLNPLDPNPSSARVDAYYEFEPDRTCGPQYFPHSLERDGEAPFIYFKARLAGNTGHYYMDTTVTPPLPLGWNCDDAGVAVAYGDGVPGAVAATKWRNPTKYQIVTAGLDGIFGKGDMASSVYPARGSKASKEGWDDFDYDNITNFCESTLGDELKL